jgi:hypothetical protein
MNFPTQSTWKWFGNENAFKIELIPSQKIGYYSSDRGR